MLSTGIAHVMAQDQQREMVQLAKDGKYLGNISNPESSRKFIYPIDGAYSGKEAIISLFSSKNLKLDHRADYLKAHMKVSDWDNLFDGAEAIVKDIPEASASANLSVIETAASCYAGFCRDVNMPWRADEIEEDILAAFSSDNLSDKKEFFNKRLNNLQNFTEIRRNNNTEDTLDIGSKTDNKIVEAYKTFLMLASKSNLPENDLEEIMNKGMSGLKEIAANADHASELKNKAEKFIGTFKTEETATKFTAQSEEMMPKQKVASAFKQELKV